PHFLFGTETWEYEDLYAADRLDITYMSIGAHVGVNFVKRIHPLKINAGVFANFTFPIIYYEFSEEEYDSYWSNSDSDVKFAFRVIPGVRTGAEILAGEHVGFSVDFIFQWLNMDMDYDFDEMDMDYSDSDTEYDITQQNTFPAIGIGFGVNFYF
ncbi:MAG: hypothetical protein JW913_04065, partial [Chitinispirillaceae bacterium]|nr:hypothetical protein [Chitinispirillaceae bacterium]